jgi:predicted nucleic-acid-binding Zn-ribbon protein
MADDLPEMKNCSECGSKAFLNEEAIAILPKTEDIPYTEFINGFCVRCSRFRCSRCTNTPAKVKDSALAAIEDWNSIE